MKKKKSNFLRNRKSFILVSVLCMGIGFAFLSSNLTITGNTSVSGNKWNVYFNNVQVSEGSVDASVVPTTTGTSTTSIDYTVTLDKPGDFYEFTVDAVNNGTIDAMIESINMTSLDTDVAKYLSYTATYLDGTPLAGQDVLEANDTTAYTVRVEFKKDIESADLSEDDINLTLTFGVNYVQSTVKQKLTPFTKLIKNTALSDTSINFGAISSASNGRGLYVMNSTAEDTYPIYYYRGAVTNNNAKFAGFCWRIVRTTETGGTKLIYNGIPNGSGECTNTTGNATQLATTSKFNTNYASPAYVGYMYGNAYEYNQEPYDESRLYGNNVTYNGTYYTLNNTKSGADSTHHYTCFTTGNACLSVNYVYNISNSKANYISLSDGKTIEDAITDMYTNTNDSAVKTAVDNWFNNTFRTYFTNNSKDYNDYLEDTIWCNDRSMNTLQHSKATSNSNYDYVNNGWISNGGSLDISLRYGAYGRVELVMPDLSCPNKNDSFTVNESTSGNGALTYPVGLLTAEEMILAGGQSYDVSHTNTDFYLYTNKSWWAMSPSHYRAMAYEYNVDSNGYVSGYFIDSTSGVRPSISLKQTVKVAPGGDGSSATPYEFIVE